MSIELDGAIDAPQVDMWKLRSEREEARKLFLHELSLELWRLPSIAVPRFCLELLQAFLEEVEQISGAGIPGMDFKSKFTATSPVAVFLRAIKEKIQEFAPTSDVERAWLLGTFVKESVFPAALGFLPSILKEDDEHPERSIMVSPAK